MKYIIYYPQDAKKSISLLSINECTFIFADHKELIDHLAHEECTYYEVGHINMMRMRVMTDEEFYKVGLYYDAIDTDEDLLKYKLIELGLYFNTRNENEILKHE